MPNEPTGPWAAWTPPTPPTSGHMAGDRQQTLTEELRSLMRKRKAHPLDLHRAIADLLSDALEPARLAHQEMVNQVGAMFDDDALRYGRVLPGKFNITNDELPGPLPPWELCVECANPNMWCDCQ